MQKKTVVKQNRTKNMFRYFFFPSEIRHTKYEFIIIDLSNLFPNYLQLTQLVCLIAGNQPKCNARLDVIRIFQD